ncbi:DUF222 domain-containing protein [Microbacterium sp. B35-30]|uniref:DUF222 domain-containing protein n=1 Tax=Microbacterium sp. B35-30 TaxID=1962642 RepID=UPI0013D71937|nr:DUF222 domain-containing protein [Microbacterium sp. B35-30]
MDDAERDEVEAQRAGDLAAQLRRIHAEEAALHARKLRLLADAFALAEAQQARIPSARSKERDMPLRALAAELGLAVKVNDRTMQSHMWDAHRLTTSFAVTVTALEAGRISRGHVTAILDCGGAIDEPAARAEFERAVLEYAETTTAARTRAYARQQADIRNPLTLQERHDLAVQGRRIWVTDLDDGMSLLNHMLPTALAHGIVDRRHGRPSSSSGSTPPAGTRCERRTKRRMPQPLVLPTAAARPRPTKKCGSTSGRSTRSAPTSSPICSSPALR